MTSAWWLDAPPQACWQLIADARRWPGWWPSVHALGAPAPAAEPRGRLRRWSVLLGRPLRLRASHRVSDPCRLIEWQIRGDIHARLTWVLASALHGGCDVTCRWEIEPLVARPAWLRALACLLFERGHFGRMRVCARGMGTALGCRTARLREWSGLAHR
jgi:hypothetical protein